MIVMDAVTQWRAISELALSVCSRLMLSRTSAAAKKHHCECTLHRNRKPDDAVSSLCTSHWRLLSAEKTSPTLFYTDGWGTQNLKRVTWRNHAPFRDSLLSVGWDKLPSTCTPTGLYVYSLQRYERRRKMHKLGWFGGRVYPRSLETSPYDRVHMTSYSTLIETIRLSCTVFEL